MIELLNNQQNILLVIAFGQTDFELSSSNSPWQIISRAIYFEADLVLEPIL
jgi:hypothetical protein